MVALRVLQRVMFLTRQSEPGCGQVTRGHVFVARQQGHHVKVFDAVGWVVLEVQSLESGAMPASINKDSIPYLFWVRPACRHTTPRPLIPHQPSLQLHTQNTVKKHHFEVIVKRGESLERAVGHVL